jgi:YVTN family beta-propeller protein
MHDQQRRWLRLGSLLLLLTVLLAPSGASGMPSGEPQPRAATGLESQGAALDASGPGATRREPASVGRGAALAAPTAQLIGDINGDGIVDIRDYGLWRQSFGATNCGNAADLNGDCIVDIRDYGIWRQNFGQTGPTVTPTATPTATPTTTPTATPTLPGRAFVANFSSANVTVIDTTTNTVVGTPIPVGTNPHGVGVDPTVHRAYVANDGANSVTVIDTTTNTVVGAPIPVGGHPIGVGIGP